MKIPVFRFILLAIICLAFVSAVGNTPLCTLSEATEPTVDYIFETIEVPGVEYLELNATNDLGHYAGSIYDPDGVNEVAFTLIDGVLTTYDFPGAEATSFFALSNTGIAVGGYHDFDHVRIYGSLILEDGELRSYDFPGADWTAIYGVSESGLLIGEVSDSDADGYSRGFVGDELFDVPGAIITHADDMNAAGIVVGSYVDVDDVYHGYIRQADGSFITFDYPGTLSNLVYLHAYAINDAGIIVFGAEERSVLGLERTYIRMPDGTIKELKFPNSLSTHGRDINNAGQVVGHYVAPGGRRHGFIATPLTDATSVDPRGLLTTLWSSLKTSLR